MPIQEQLDLRKDCKDLLGVEFQDNALEAPLE